MMNIVIICIIWFNDSQTSLIYLIMTVWKYILLFKINNSSHLLQHAQFRHQ